MCIHILFLLIQFTILIFYYLYILFLYYCLTLMFCCNYLRALCNIMKEFQRSTAAVGVGGDEHKPFTGRQSAAEPRQSLAVQDQSSTRRRSVWCQVRCHYCLVKLWSLPVGDFWTGWHWHRIGGSRPPTWGSQSIPLFFPSPLSSLFTAFPLSLPTVSGHKLSKAYLVLVLYIKSVLKFS